MLARHVICAIGRWTSFDPVEAVLGGCELDREYSQLAPDARMPRAFEASVDRVDPSLTDDDWGAVARHTAVAYVLSPRIVRGDAQAIAQRTLAVVAALFDAGALAVKGESSGIAHGEARWRELARRAASRDALERASALRAAWVRRPLRSDDGGVLYSCGMHLLGEPDAEIDLVDDPHEAVSWMDLLALYLLAEKPERGVSDGEGFRMEAGGERRILRARPCERYERDDFFYNPHGYWRLEPS